MNVIYFTPVRETMRGDLMMCSECGCAVVDEYHHRLWHDANDRPF